MHLDARARQLDRHAVASGRAISVTCAASSRYYSRPGIVFIPISDIPPSHYVIAFGAGDGEPLVQNFVRLAVAVRDGQDAHPPA